MKIGDLRRSLLVEWPCKWNGVVRDITASLETEDEEVNEHIVYVGLLGHIKLKSSLDRQFPRKRLSRVDELFAEE